MSKPSLSELLLLGERVSQRGSAWLLVANKVFLCLFFYWFSFEFVFFEPCPALNSKSPSASASPGISMGFNNNRGGVSQRWQHPLEKHTCCQGGDLAGFHGNAVSLVSPCCVSHVPASRSSRRLRRPTCGR